MGYLAEQMLQAAESPLRSLRQSIAGSLFIRYTSSDTIAMHPTSTFRSDISERARRYAMAQGVPYCLSYGEQSTVCFSPSENNSRHGNFLARSYTAIRANPEWSKRLEKVHTQGRRCLPANERGHWRELDTCVSSDALLMNIFCYPGVRTNSKVLAFLNLQASVPLPEFGYRARVPFINGRLDRTEVDLRIGDLLIEAKLTESDFQSAATNVVFKYRDLTEVFDTQELPQTEKRFCCYQLLRNVLAAYALNCSFCVLIDARRPDLAEAWYSVIRAVRWADLRTRLRIATWQELATVLPTRLRSFLAAKYGICGKAVHYPVSPSSFISHSHEPAKAIDLSQ